MSSDTASAKERMVRTHIRVIAICLFRHKGRILVFEGYDTVKKDYYYRPLGGAVEPGETTAQTLAREIREELGQEITDVRLLGVLENLFTCDGKAGHEIVFVYDGHFVDESIYSLPEMTMTEDGGVTARAMWHGMDSFDATHRLVPESLASLLNSEPSLA